MDRALLTAAAALWHLDDVALYESTDERPPKCRRLMALRDGGVVAFERVAAATAVVVRAGRRRRHRPARQSGTGRAEWVVAAAAQRERPEPDHPPAQTRRARHPAGARADRHQCPGVAGPGFRRAATGVDNGRKWLAVQTCSHQRPAVPIRPHTISAGFTEIQGGLPASAILNRAQSLALAAGVRGGAIQLL